MAQTTSVTSPEILLIYQIRQKKGGTHGGNRTHDLSGPRKRANWAANFTCSAEMSASIPCECGGAALECPSVEVRPDLVALCQALDHGLADHGKAAVPPLDVAVVDAQLGLPVYHELAVEVGRRVAVAVPLCPFIYRFVCVVHLPVPTVVNTVGRSEIVSTHVIVFRKTISRCCSYHAYLKL